MTRVRSILKQTSEADRDYNALVREPNENLAPITRSSIFIGSAFATYVTSKSKPEVVVSGAYTRPGWEGYVRDKLDKDRAQSLSNDGWVLGETEVVSLDRIQRTLQDLRDRYFAAYRNAWSDFLKDLDVRQPDSNSEALDELQALSETPWPYSKLLTTLGDNTRLELAPVSVANQGGQALLDRAAEKAKQNQTVQTILGADGGAPPPKRWVSPVEEAFQPMVAFGVPAADERGREARADAALPLRRRDRLQGRRRAGRHEGLQGPGRSQGRGAALPGRVPRDERAALVDAERVHAAAALPAPHEPHPPRATPASSATSRARQAASGSSTSGRSGATRWRASTPSPTRRRT